VAQLSQISFCFSSISGGSSVRKSSFGTLYL
jgi:hypothetical protein